MSGTLFMWVKWNWTNLGVIYNFLVLYWDTLDSLSILKLGVKKLYTFGCCENLTEWVQWHSTFTIKGFRLVLGWRDTFCVAWTYEVCTTHGHMKYILQEKLKSLLTFTTANKILKLPPKKIYYFFYNNFIRQHWFSHTPIHFI